MALTLLRPSRPQDRTATGPSPLRSAVLGPVGAVLASCALAGVFLLAVADLVSRLG